MHGAFRSGHAGNNTPLPSSFDTVIREAGYCPDFFTLHYRQSMPEHGNGTNRSRFLRSEEKRSPLCSFKRRQKFFSPPEIHHFLFPPAASAKRGGQAHFRGSSAHAFPTRQTRTISTKEKTPRKAGKNGRNLPDSSSARSFLFFPKVQSQGRTPCAATIPYERGKKSGCLDGHGEPWL